MFNDIKILVGCLATHDDNNNDGEHAKWIDATLDPFDIDEQIEQLLATSPVEDAEDYIILDSDGFEGVTVDKNASIEDIHDLATFIDDHGDLGAELIKHFCGNVGEAQNAMDEHVGGYASLADYAQQVTERDTEIPDNLSPYIDYEAMARDMQFHGRITVIQTAYNEVHVFLYP